ncbi:MAG: tetratricopeptide repeat protein [Armatimonadota bacterium]
MAHAPAAPQLAEGEKHLDAGEWPAAEAAFRRAAEIDPTSAVAFSKLGVALAHQRRLDEAEGAFARAVEVSPRYAPAWSNLGNVYRETGRIERALEAYERAVAADPDYWVAHQNLGGLYKQLGRTSEAIASLRKATRLSARGALRSATGEGRRRLGCFGSAALLLLLVIALAVA